MQLMNLVFLYQMCENPYMFYQKLNQFYIKITIIIIIITTSKKINQLRKLSFNSCILYLIFGGKKLHNCSDSPIPTENQITEVKNSNRLQAAVSHDRSDLWTIVRK